MIYFKKKIGITILMLCFVLYGTSAMGCKFCWVLSCFCCHCCCAAALPPAWCSLCLEEITQENKTEAPSVYCRSCYDLYKVIEEDEVRIPYLNIEKEESKGKEAATPRTPLLVKHDSRLVHSTPAVVHYVKPSRLDCISRWADKGLQVIVREFITGHKYTHASLLEFINAQKIYISTSRQAAFVQGVYMVWLHKMASDIGKTNHRTRALVSADIERQESDLFAVLSDRFFRSLVKRMKILDGSRDLIDPRLLRIINTLEITDEDCEYKEKETGLTLLDLMVQDIYMGWPCFLDGKEADDYLALMPPSYRKTSIRRQSGKQPSQVYVVWDLPVS